YVMGKRFLDRRDSRLGAFIEGEKKKASEQKEYAAFVDSGPPLLKDGSLNKELILQYGLKIPEEKYFGLGDNHAVSADCRDFGFIPQGNLKGAPAFIVTPIPKSIQQADYPFFTRSKMIVVSIVLGSWAIWHFATRQKRRFPLPFN
ncbi:MAG: S26 family signal peptidase, partial [Chlamydiia bacterium]